MVIVKAAPTSRGTILGISVGHIFRKQELPAPTIGGQKHYKYYLALGSEAVRDAVLGSKSCTPRPGRKCYTGMYGGVHFAVVKAALHSRFGGGNVILGITAGVRDTFSVGKKPHPHFAEKYVTLGISVGYILQY